jgi:hypothetical protein
VFQDASIKGLDRLDYSGQCEMTEKLEDAIANVVTLVSFDCCG